MLTFFDFVCVGRAKSVLGFAVLLLAFWSLPLFGQSLQSSASLSGIVTDAQGARVAGATVTVSNLVQNFTRTFTTDSSGAYSFTLLPPAVYSLRVEAGGFKKFEQGNIVLEVGQAGALNVSLVVGNVTETVEVTGEPPLLNTDNAQIATEIASKQIVDLPLNDRNPFFLTFLDSAVRNTDEGYMGGGLDNNDQAVGFMSFGGQFQQWNAFFVDGAWDTEMNNGIVDFVPSVDDVQEFKVQTNSFSAQYGFSAGNVITLVTKSGSSHFHGDAFEFFRNDALDANYYFNDYHDVRKPNVHLQQFGGSEGGPLYIPGLLKRKDRTFFFVLFEGFRSAAVSPFSGSAPTSAFKSGDLSGLLTGQNLGTDALCRPIMAGQIYNPTPVSVTSTCPITEGSTVIPAGSTVLVRNPITGNNLSGMVTPVAQNMLQYFPTPTTSAIGNNFFASSAVPIVYNEIAVRIDHNITDTARIYGRFTHKSETQTTAGDLYGAHDPGGPGQVSPNNRYSVALGYSQMFSPTLTASLNMGFQRWVGGSNGEGYRFQPSSLGLPAALNAITPMFPQISFSADVNSLIAGLTSAYTPLGTSSQGATPDQIGTVSADFTKVLHTHTLSFGWIAASRQVNSESIGKTTFNFTQGFTSGPDPGFPTPGTGDSFASFLLGDAFSGSTGIVASPAQTQHTQGLYIQDNWKVARRLNINLGLRYDLQGAPTERYNHTAYFDPTKVNPISSLVPGGNGPYLGELVYNSASNRGLFQTHYDNFAPRAGFTYQVFKSLIARGGFGIFYPPDFWDIHANPGYSQTTNYVSSLNGGLSPAPGYNLSTPFPSGILPVTGNANGGLTDVGQSIGQTIQYQNHSPYVEMWTFGLQYSPSSKDVVEADYVGNHVNHLPVGNGINLNELPPADLALGNAALTAPVNNPFANLAAMAGSSCGLQNPTVPRFQLMLPMPQYCDNVDAFLTTIGESLFDSMQLKYTHRAKNLTILANYTLYKWLDDATFMSPGNDIFYTSITRNNYDLKAEKSLDNYSSPNSAVVSFIYNLPFGRGQRFGSGFNRVENAILGGWEWSAINTFRQGSPISPQANTNNGTLFGGNRHADIVGDPNQPGNFAGNPGCIGPTQIHTVAAWYNPCAFITPTGTDFGDAPRYLDLFSPSLIWTDMAAEKWFNLKGEALRMQFRGEFFNAFNHPLLGTPLAGVGTSTAGVISFADVSRQIQLAVKFYW
jgi:Carboxypeptidase regulatory-like domain/TonB dependent receptor